MPALVPLVQDDPEWEESYAESGRGAANRFHLGLVECSMRVTDCRPTGRMGLAFSFGGPVLNDVLCAAIDSIFRFMPSGVNPSGLRDSAVSDCEGMTRLRRRRTSLVDPTLRVRPRLALSNQNLTKQGMS